MVCVLSLANRSPKHADNIPVCELSIVARSLKAAAPPVWRGGLSSYRTGTWGVPDDYWELCLLIEKSDFRSVDPHIHAI